MTKTIVQIKDNKQRRIVIPQEVWDLEKDCRKMITLRLTLKRLKSQSDYGISFFIQKNKSP